MRWNGRKAWAYSSTAIVLLLCTLFVGMWYANERMFDEMETKNYMEAQPVQDVFEASLPEETNVSSIEEQRYWKGTLASIVLKSPNIWTACVWNLETGKQVPLYSLLAFSTEAEAREYILTSFITLINEEPDRYYHDAVNLLKGLVDQTGYYVTEDGLTLFFNPGILGPEEEGVVDVTITYQGNPELFSYNFQTGEKKQ